jgi:hypothetical protein
MARSSDIMVRQAARWPSAPNQSTIGRYTLFPHLGRNLGVYKVVLSLWMLISELNSPLPSTASA